MSAGTLDLDELALATAKRVHHRQGRSSSETGHLDFSLPLAEIEREDVRQSAIIVKGALNRASDASRLEGFSDAEALIAEGLERMADELAAERTPCLAEIWHGPGHQSRSTCEVLGPHKIHEARIGRYDELARWRGDRAHSGYFDEAPDLCESDPERKDVAPAKAIKLLRSAALAVRAGQFRDVPKGERDGDG